MEETRQGEESQRRVEPMHRGGPGRMVTGVCLALARQLGLAVGLVRLAFVITLMVSGGTALSIYLLLWFLTPASAVGQAPVQRVLTWLSRLLGTPAVEESRWERKV